MPVIMLLTAISVVVASGAHLSVSRHAPPPGWGYVWAVYEAGTPLLLLGAHVWPLYGDALRLLAAVVAVIGATLGSIAARFAGPALKHTIAEAEFASVVRKGARWKKSSAKRELQGIMTELRRVQQRHDRSADSDPTPEA